jgi:formate hydrogenlyase transcriptional activator
LSRERHHEAIFKVNRALITCAGSASYAVDEQALFQSVCDTLVRSGLFQLAWFGYAKGNEGRVDEPVARSGDEHGFFEDLKLALGLDDYEDPATVAIRTGEPCWILDLATHPGLGPIRPAVLRRGLTSVISVPVTAKDNAYGVLTLYYDDPEQYGQSVVSILKERLPHVQAVFAGRLAAPRSRPEELEIELRGLIDALPLNVGLNSVSGNLIYLNRHVVEYSGYTLEDWVFGGARIDYDYERVMLEIAKGIARGAPFTYQSQQLRHRDRQYRWHLVNVTPIRDEDGQIIRWCFAGTDIQELKQAHEKLRRSEAFLAQGQSISHTGTFGRNVVSGETWWSEEFYNILELDRSVEPALERVLERIHPEDSVRVRQTIEDATRHRTDFDLEYRSLSRNGSVKNLRAVVQALESASGELELVGAVTDITAAKQAEDQIRQSEREARQLLDLSPLHITLLGPDGTPIYANQAALDYYGATLEAWQDADFQRLIHPEDAVRAIHEVRSRLLDGFPFEYEARLKGKDGRYRWFQSRFSPMSAGQGYLTRWYVAATDINDRRLAEQRLQDENVALREEIDKASMFEEIVGASAPLQRVLSRVSKVAPTDSSVLITGETGTGKELVARAIHRRSRRSSHPFVSVNCAAIPRDLIASELFGHEKGAFTGATQRRLGRFELAEKGTIFLDEVGELPAETQIALLRVLQEREFERIGGAGSIETDVRVVAATNRDLEAAIAAGTFRSDLYYRLNVFPIEMPTLRERIEDIPLLVAYFLNRYARKAGRHFTAVDKQSLDLLQSYPWPGNIRELQNVIERSVIVSDTEIFSVDESWLSRQPQTRRPKNLLALPQKLAAQEKETIEAALRECRGRVSGSTGAAARLGMPGSTLESKIKSLKIDKNRFRTSS